MAVETYSHVMHIVSSVSGTLREEVDAMDALRGVAARRHALRRAEDPRDADHRRARAGQARRPTAARSATCPTRATSTPASTSAPRVVKDGRVHVQAGAGIVADSDPDYEVRETRGQGAARVLEAIELACEQRDWAERSLVIDNYDSFTYNLVQYLGELGAELEVVRNDAATVASCSSAARPRGRLARARARPAEAGVSVEAIAPLRRGRACRCSASASATRRWRQAFGGRVVRGEPVHGKTADVEHDGRTIFAGSTPRSSPGRYHSLVVDPELPDELERSARGRRRRDGRPPPRAAGRGRAVPPRVGAHRGRQGACCATSSRAERADARRPDRRDRPLAPGEDLTADEAAAVLREVMAGDASEVADGRFLIALRTKGETVDEIAGLARTMRELAAPRRASRATTCSTPPAPAAGGRPSTSPPPPRSSRPAPAAGWPSTATAPPPASPARPTCSRRSARASTSSPSAVARLHRRGRLRLHVRARATTRRCATWSRSARSSACARSSTSSGR